MIAPQMFTTGFLRERFVVYALIGAAFSCMALCERAYSESPAIDAEHVVEVTLVGAIDDTGHASDQVSDVSEFLAILDSAVIDSTPCALAAVRSFAPKAVASDSTIELTAGVTHVTGTMNINAITPSVATWTFGGCVTLIADTPLHMTDMGNIAVARSISINEAIDLCYLPSTHRWHDASYATDAGDRDEIRNGR